MSTETEKKGIGETILETIAAPMIPLGADPAQMRADQGDGEEPDEKKEDEPDEEPMELSKSVLRTFHSFYIEGKHQEAAETIAEAVGEVDGEVKTSEAEWAEFIAEASASKLNFLRKSMMKFQPFLNTAKGSWEKLSDKQKESAVKFLQGKSSKMATELKSLVGGLTAKSPADKVMMAAMMAYMFGVGMSGEGAVGESEDQGE